MNIKKYFKVLKDGTKNMFKEFFNKKTNKKQRANMWTFQRLIIPIITLITSIIGMINGIIPLLVLSSVLIGYGGITDYFDGKAARKYGSVSEYGKVLDQVVDKYFAGMISINIAIINPIYIPVVLMELAISGVNMFYKHKYPTINDKSSMIGRIKQWPLFISLFLGFLSPINELLSIITTNTVILTLVLQSITLTEYTVSKYKEAKKIDENKNQRKIINEPIKQTKKSNNKIKIIGYNKTITNKKYKVKVKKKIINK